MGDEQYKITLWNYDRSVCIGGFRVIIQYIFNSKRVILYDIIV